MSEELSKAIKPKKVRKKNNNYKKYEDVVTYATEVVRFYAGRHHTFLIPGMQELADTLTALGIKYKD